MTPLFFSIGSWPWGHQEAFDGDTSSEVYLYPMFATSSFHTFTESLIVGYNHVGLLVICLIVIVSSVLFLLGRFLHLHFYSIDCPCGVCLGHLLVGLYMYLIEFSTWQWCCLPIWLSHLVGPSLLFLWSGSDIYHIFMMIFILFLRISKLHEIKQNEKYPYAN